MSRMTQGQMSLYKFGRIAHDSENLGIIAYKGGGHASVLDEAHKTQHEWGYMDRKIAHLAAIERNRGGVKPLRSENVAGEEHQDWYTAAKKAWWLELEEARQGGEWRYYVGNYWSHAVLRPSWLDVQYVVQQHRLFPQLRWDLWELMLMGLAVGGDWEASIYE